MALLFTTRHHRREVVLAIAQPDLFEHRVGNAHGIGAPGDVRAEADVLESGQPGNRLKLWKTKLTVSCR